MDAESAVKVEFKQLGKSNDVKKKRKRNGKFLMI